MDSNIKKSIILENYQEPYNKGIPNKKEDYIKINSNSVSCIDNIDIYVKINNNIIEDIMFEGEACVIATSSTSILINKLIGKTLEEGKILIDNYLNMINESSYDKNILGDALAYEDISKQPARISCATIFIKGFSKLYDKRDING